MTDAPVGWSRVRLADVVTPMRSAMKPGARPDLPYLGLENVEAQTTAILGTASSSSVRSTSFYFVANSTLYARLRPYLNKVCSPHFDGLGSGEFIILPPTPHLAPGFLKYLLNQPAFVAFTSGLDTGDRPRVSWDGVCRFEFDLPPLAEQHRIVAAIDEEFSRLDAGLAALKRVQHNLKRMQHSVLQQTSPESLPPGWVWAPIGQTVGIVDYRGRTPPFSSSGIPHLRSFNIKSGAIDWTGCAFVSDATYEKYMSRGFPAAGDLLFTTEAPMGEVAPAPTVKFCMAQRMMLLKPDARVWLAEYLMYHLKSPSFQERLRIHATGTTVQGISSRNFRPLPLPIPPLNEQDRLAARIRDQLRLVVSAEQAIRDQAKRCERLRSAILSAAFAGKLVPQDPSDEAASLLLERIAAERTASSRTKAASGRRPSNIGQKVTA